MVFSLNPMSTGSTVAGSDGNAAAASVEERASETPRCTAPPSAVTIVRNTSSRQESNDPKPGVLDGVIRLVVGTEHSVGDGPQSAAARLEPLQQPLRSVHSSQPP